jgi:hypothetical protein
MASIKETANNKKSCFTLMIQQQAHEAEHHSTLK